VLNGSRRDLDAKGAALALLASLLWGGNTVAIKIGLLDAPPLRLAWMRFAVGGAVVLAWAWASGGLRGFAVAREERRPLVVLGLIFAAQIAGINIGTSLTSASHAALLLNVYAVHIVVLAHFMIPGDRLTLRRGAGVLVAYLGIALIFARPAATGSPTLLGDAIVFASAFVLAERTVYMARAVQHLDPIKILLAQILIGGACFVAGSPLVESQPTAWTARLAGSLVYQGAIIAGFNFLLNLWLLKHYRPSALAACFLSQPIFGVLAAWLVTGDPLTPDLVVASVCVAIGIGLATR
jgi:drug/metabolite transporter (DMT)-like permease